MLLKDCVLDFDAVITAPLTRTAPEEDWKCALETGLIPKGLYELYSRANYLSFGSEPSFLHDPDHVLFSYFGLVLRSIMESLKDADEQLGQFALARNLGYDAGKQIRGDTWDKDANRRAKRHFRDLLIALQTSLDALADIIAIFVTGFIKGLEVGRAQFSSIEAWLRTQLLPSGPIVTPFQYYAQKLHDALLPIVQAPAPETDWLPLMRLFRNKAAHLGTPLFRDFGLHDTTPRFYTFIPREWPFLWEKHIKDAGAGNRVPARQLLEQTLIHQDDISYTRGLRNKVTELIAAGIAVINEAYDQVKDAPRNSTALSQLEGNSKSYSFEHFV